MDTMSNRCVNSKNLPQQCAYGQRGAEGYCRKLAGLDDSDEEEDVLG